MCLLREGDVRGMSLFPRAQRHVGGASGERACLPLRGWCSGIGSEAEVPSNSEGRAPVTSGYPRVDDTRDISKRDRIVITTTETDVQRREPNGYVVSERRNARLPGLRAADGAQGTGIDWCSWKRRPHRTPRTDTEDETSPAEKQERSRRGPRERGEGGHMPSGSRH